jgi:hypothetical protein
MNQSFIFLLLAALSACATLDKEGCEKANWSTRGYSDGAAGLEPRIDSYVAQCREQGVSIPVAKYQTSYSEGLKSFCTYQNGLARGQRGEEPFGGCRGMETNFYRGYQIGFREFEQKRLNEQRKNSRDQAIKQILSRYNTKECLMDSDCRVEGMCTFGRCAGDQTPCTWNTDCQARGKCDEKAEFLHETGEWVRVRLCVN